jgi:uncharacterized RmlC-like cupin family protein
VTSQVFADRNRFASWTGTAPLDASSAEQIRHRLSRAGNRRLNHVLHIAAIVQLRNDTEGRVYYRRKLTAGKTPLEALRCLKRRLSDVIFRRPVADAREREVSGQGTGPGGHRGATQQSSAVDLPPPIDTSDQPLPDPQSRRYAQHRTPGTPTQTEHSNPSLDTEGSQMRMVLKDSPSEVERRIRLPPLSVSRNRRQTWAADGTSMDPGPMRPEGAVMDTQQDPILVVTPADRTAGPATPGMDRQQAIATDGSWAGFVRTEAGMVSGWHHHGEYETVIYVLSGALKMEFGPNGSYTVEAGPGDFVYVPKGAVHRESNPSLVLADIIVVRAGSGESTFNVGGPPSP